MNRIVTVPNKGRVPSLQKLVDAAVQTYGRVDVMINNAGLMPQAPLELLKIDEWYWMIDVNIKGVLYGIAAALPHMKQQKSGHFITSHQLLAIRSVRGSWSMPRPSLRCGRSPKV